MTIENCHNIDKTIGVMLRGVFVTATIESN